MKKLIFLFVFICCISFGAYAQDGRGSIEVTGISAAEALPKELVVNVPLVVTDSTYLSCSKRLNALLTEVQKELEKRGIDREDISTGNYSISENFEFKQGERKSTGYKGQVNLSLKKRYEPEFIDEFLQVAEKFSLQYTIRFMLSEEQKELLSKTALVEAVDDAKRKAQILAEASGVRLGSISKISYGESMGRPGPLTEVARLSSDGVAADPNGLKLYPGEISVHQSVRVIWHIAQ